MRQMCCYAARPGACEVRTSFRHGSRGPVAADVRLQP